MWLEYWLTTFSSAHVITQICKYVTDTSAFIHEYLLTNWLASIRACAPIFKRVLLLVLLRWLIKLALIIAVSMFVNYALLSQLKWHTSFFFHNKRGTCACVMCKVGVRRIIVVSECNVHNCCIGYCAGGCERGSAKCNSQCAGAMHSCWMGASCADWRCV